MEDPEGTDGEQGGCTGWFSVEAIIEKRTGDKVSEDEDEDASDTGSDLIGFIDDTHIENIQADTQAARALFNLQEEEDDLNAVSALKRKFTGIQACGGNSNGIENQACTAAKRRAYDIEDSGYGNTEVETQETMVQVEGQNGDMQCSSQCSTGASSTGNSVDMQSESNSSQEQSMPLQTVENIMHVNNIKATLMHKFKEAYGVTFTQLIRPFKSDRTSCTDWCVTAFGITPSVAESLKVLIKPQTLYTHLQCLTCDRGIIILLLVRFKCAKNRLTVSKLMSNLLSIPETHMIIEPPKIRSTTCALYWFRTGMSNISEVSGQTPEWIERLTVLQHSFDDTIFDLGEMVQWAYDNDITDDSEIAYQYAMLADVNSNAAAFLKSNSQAKIVKDCGTMCRHYKRAEKRKMTIGQWIQARCDKVNDGGDWRTIVKLLRYQNVEFTQFLATFKKFLKGIPKKSCMVICGPPNTGKTYFAMSLIHFLQGCVISYVNAKSHFWLQPLSDAKIGMIDDVTAICWTYIDDYLRNALDGNDISIDVKHKALVQLKCPPLLLTSNIDVATDSRWPFLHSRVVVFRFNNPFPFDENGNPVYNLNDENWKSFFSRTWCQLDLIEEEDKENHGGNFNTFKCSAGENSRCIRS